MKNWNIKQPSRLCIKKDRVDQYIDETHKMIYRTICKHQNNFKNECQPENCPIRIEDE